MRDEAEPLVYLDRMARQLGVGDSFDGWLDRHAERTLAEHAEAARAVTMLWALTATQDELASWLLDAILSGTEAQGWAYPREGL